MKKRCVIGMALVALMFARAGIAEEGKAIFAGGCFWCMESDFDRVPGVTKTVAGYIPIMTQNAMF